ncbi:ribosome silencing factor [Candidatus Tisiphia endosymbiont of Nemotelus uliginosus]|uniref:ribosome silencing factor n=1 Tax=Candidatus Tisiphia endosymbiont of Nemotelus uliginosus TaxID=3077926 RepID=UPI0035C88D60
MLENVETLKEFIVQCLEAKKADAITIMDLKKDTTLAEYIIFANGRSTKNVGAIAEYVALELKQQAGINVNIEGLGKSEWVLIDAGNILINIFYPEVREHFKLEEMWKQKNSAL